MRRRAPRHRLLAGLVAGPDVRAVQQRTVGIRDPRRRAPHLELERERGVVVRRQGVERVPQVRDHLVLARPRRVPRRRLPQQPHAERRGRTALDEQRREPPGLDRDVDAERHLGLVGPCAAQRVRHRPCDARDRLREVVERQRVAQRGDVLLTVVLPGDLDHDERRARLHLGADDPRHRSAPWRPEKRDFSDTVAPPAPCGTGEKPQVAPRAARGAIRPVSRPVAGLGSPSGARAGASSGRGGDGWRRGHAGSRW